MAQTIIYMFLIAMDCVQSRSIPSIPVWDMEAKSDTGTRIPPSASKFMLVTVSPFFPIHIYLSTTDVLYIKEKIINIILTTIRHLKQA